MPRARRNTALMGVDRLDDVRTDVVIAVGGDPGPWAMRPLILEIKDPGGLALVADRSLTGLKVAGRLHRSLRAAAAPMAITVDNSGESSVGRWTRGPTHTACGSNLFGQASQWKTRFIESFNGRLRDECVNRMCSRRSRRAAHPRRLARWITTKSALTVLEDRTPVEMASLASRLKFGKTERKPRFHAPS